MDPYINRILEENIALHQTILGQNKIRNDIHRASYRIRETMLAGRNVITCGNGTNAGLAQMMSAAFVGQFEKERVGFGSITLGTNLGITTALSQQDGYSEMYASQLKAIGKKGDLLLTISFSGDEENLVRTMETAKALGLRCVALTGPIGGKMKELADFCIEVPSENKARVREAHAVIIHILCGLLEQSLPFFALKK